MVHSEQRAPSIRTIHCAERWLADVCTWPWRWHAFYGIARVFRCANQHEQAHVFNLQMITIHPLMHKIEGQHMCQESQVGLSFIKNKSIKDFIIQYPQLACALTLQTLLVQQYTSNINKHICMAVIIRFTGICLWILNRISLKLGLRETCVFWFQLKLQSRLKLLIFLNSMLFMFWGIVYPLKPH